MKIKSIVILLPFLLLLSGITVPATACCEGDPPGDPDCYVCEDGAWVLEDGAECGVDSDCGPPGCWNCVNCQCEYQCNDCQVCWAGSCVLKYGANCAVDLDCEYGGEGCESCVDCICEDDDSKCDTANCYECSNGSCVYKCASDECCIDGECVAPICDNCHEVNDVLIECGHDTSDPVIGDLCISSWCIKNILDTATCDHKGPTWPCNKTRCNTRQNPLWYHEVEQIEIAKPCSTPHIYVEPELWVELWYGCWSCNYNYWEIACEATTTCRGAVVERGYRGYQKICGCGY